MQQSSPRSLVLGGPAGSRFAFTAAVPRRGPCRMRAASRGAAASGSMTFHINETALTFPMKPEQAKELSGAITKVMQTFADKQQATRPKRLEAMEYRIKGDAANPSELEFFEIFCNPNAHATAFDAKVLVTLRTAGGVKVTTEGKLTSLKNDVDQFMAQGH